MATAYMLKHRSDATSTIVFHTHRFCSMMKRPRKMANDPAIKAVEDVVFEGPARTRGYIRVSKDGERIGRLCRLCEARLHQIRKSGLIRIRVNADHGMCPACGYELPEHVAVEGMRLFCQECGRPILIERITTIYTLSTDVKEEP